MVASAVISYVGYGWESTYATASSTVNKAFGAGVRITTLNRKNNVEKEFTMGARNAQTLTPKKFEASLTVESVLANPWFWKGVLGGVTDGGATPYTHTYAEADTIPSVTISNNLGMAADADIRPVGGKFGTCTLTSAVGELVRTRLDIPYANETFSTSTSAKLTESFALYTFAQGTLEMPNGTTLAQVQNFECTINNNPEAVWGQGSRFAVEMPVKNREYTGSITMALQQSADLLDKFYGATTGPVAAPAETATLEMTFTNGLTSSSQRSQVLTFTGVQLDEENMPQDPTAVIMEDVVLSMRSLAVVCSDNTQTAL